jgi:flavin-dependent dehydrogenase
MYDAIVIGARCAGAPTAMLLARAGHRVLLCDKAVFPSETGATGSFQAPGIAYLRRWGLLDALVATGTPAVTRLEFDVAGQQRTVRLPSMAATYAPTRAVLDHLLVRAAVDAGVELRPATSLVGVESADGRVTEARLSQGGAETIEQARILIGADGVHSTTARLVSARAFDEVPVTGSGAYGYFEGLDCDAYEFHGPGRVWSVMVNPTSGGKTSVLTAGDMGGSASARFDNVLAGVPAVAERVKAARLVDRIVGYRMEPLFYRPAFGPGWALVGDAGFHQGPISGLGMSHAFRDAQRLAMAVDDGLRSRMTMDEALAGYAADRDRASRPIYDAIASSVTAPADSRPTDPERLQLLVLAWSLEAASEAAHGPRRLALKAAARLRRNR